jgi:hypothetical protein
VAERLARLAEVGNAAKIGRSLVVLVNQQPRNSKPEFTATVA